MPARSTQSLKDVVRPAFACLVGGKTASQRVDPADHVAEVASSDEKATVSGVDIRAMGEAWNTDFRSWGIDER